MILFTRIYSLLIALTLLVLYGLILTYFYLFKGGEEITREDMIVSIVVLVVALFILLYIIITWRMNTNTANQFLLDEEQIKSMNRRWYFIPLSVINALIAFGSFGAFGNLLIENRKEYLTQISYDNILDPEFMAPLSLIILMVPFGFLHLYYVIQMTRFYRQKTK